MNDSPTRRRDLVAILALASMTTLAAPIGLARADAPAVTCDGLTATIVGTQGDDVLTGTPGSDVIAGLAGNDVIDGGSGDDVICGGAGADVIAGQGDDDRLFGEQGTDHLDGGEGGCCAVPANTGDDFLSGGPDADVLHSADFPTTGSTLHGDEGEDQLFLWSGGYASGGEGDDVLVQYTKAAVLDGGEGDDVLTDRDDAALGHETVSLLGGLGDDTLVSQDSTSDSTLDGSSGIDVCAGGDTTAGCEA